MGRGVPSDFVVTGCRVLKHGGSKATSSGMDRPPPVIDMLPDGSFRVPPRRPMVPLSAKLLIGAVLMTALAASVAIAALAIWVVSLVLPVIIIGGAFIWAMAKFRHWQSLRGDPGSVTRRYPGGFGQ